MRKKSNFNNQQRYNSAEVITKIGYTRKVVK